MTQDVKALCDLYIIETGSKKATSTAIEKLSNTKYGIIMGQISNTGLEAWVVRRIMGFFNRATVATDISQGILKDDPDSGSGRFVIGEVVAQRILERRNTLPGQRFTEVRQLDGLRGLGADKFHDLIFSLSQPAAEAFRQAMYLHVIRENWALRHHSVRFEDEQQFLDLVGNTDHFRAWIEGQAAIIARDRHHDNRTHTEVRRRLRASALEIFENGEVGAHELAFWFYKVDGDNWFNFEQALKQTRLFLDFMPDFLDRTELRMFHGFKNHDLLADEISPSGLPVTVNFSEQVISIWIVELRD